MPKKTRKQKVRSDIRHTPHIPTSISYTFSTPLSKTTTQDIVIVDIKKDVFKTLVIGAIIIAVELLLAVNKQKLGW